jgi:hypothetical protein
VAKLAVVRPDTGVRPVTDVCVVVRVRDNVGVCSGVPWELWACYCL